MFEATIDRMPTASVLTWSLTLCGFSPPKTVTALCSAGRPAHSTV
jgi:hypothetical protein